MQRIGRSPARMQAVASFETPAHSLERRGKSGTRHETAASSPSLHAAIENDRDFGPVLALRSGVATRRVVRALPASTDDLRDAAQELAGIDKRLSGSLERIVGSLQDWIASNPSGAEASVDLTLPP